MLYSGWLGLNSSGASEDAERARMPRFKFSQAERGSAGERSPATLGRGKRPREKQAKTGPAKQIKNLGTVPFQSCGIAKTGTVPVAECKFYRVENPIIS